MTIRKIRNRFKIVENEISQLVEGKYIFEKYKEYIENSKNIDKQNGFLFWIAKNYQILALINVCKQVDKGREKKGKKERDVESLVNLLKAIKDNKDLFALRWYKKRWEPIPISGTNKKISRKKEAEEYFKEFSIKNNKVISSQKIDDDIKKIKLAICGLRFGNKRQSISSLLKYRHKRGAHFANDKKKVNVPAEKLDEAINLLEQMILKYDLLINQSSPETLLPGNIDEFIELKKIFK